MIDPSSTACVRVVLKYKAFSEHPCLVVASIVVWVCHACVMGSCCLEAVYEIVNNLLNLSFMNSSTIFLRASEVDGGMCSISASKLSVYLVAATATEQGGSG